MHEKRFNGKEVVVTGGASGIGQAIARGFCNEGASVLVADLSAELAEKTAGDLRQTGGKARACRVDVADPTSVEDMMRQVGAHLDVLVCAAGIFSAGTAEATELDAWCRTMNINLTGTFLCARAAVPLMRGRGGSIITLSSSTGAHDAIAGAVAYVASKGGVTMLTKAMAVDHAAENIRVNAIAPGPTDTPMLRGLMSETDRIAFGNSLPIRRLGLPQDFVGAALFLGSDEAAFVTGVILPVDGGQTAQV